MSALAVLSEQPQPDEMNLADHTEDFIATGNIRVGNRHGKVSLLVTAVANDRTGAPPAAEDTEANLLEKINATVRSLQAEEVASRRTLYAAFIMAYKAGGQKHAALLMKQHALNNTKHWFSERHKRIQAAVEYLQVTDAKLRESIVETRDAMAKIEKAA